MNPRLTAIVSRAAAVSLAAATAVVLYVLAVAMPLALQDNNAEKIADLQDRLARYRVMAAEAPRIRTAIENLARRSGDDGLYLEGSTDALAAAQLVERMKRDVQENGGRVSAAQNLPAGTADDLLKISVRIQFTGPVGTVRGVLYAVEMGRPMLFVEGMEIRETTRNLSDQARDGDPVLGIRLDIAGYLKGRAGG